MSAKRERGPNIGNCNGKIICNGREIDPSKFGTIHSMTISDDGIYINGKKISEEDAYQDEKGSESSKRSPIQITIQNCIIQELKAEDTVSTISITDSDVQTIRSGSGSVTAQNVSVINTASGSVRCGDVSGSVNTDSGSVHAKSIMGNVCTASGRITNHFS